MLMRRKSERKSTDGESRFLHSTLCRPNLLSERVVQLKLARKLHGIRRSKKNLEGLYKYWHPFPTSSKTVQLPRQSRNQQKNIVTNRNSDIAKFGTQQERQKHIKVYAKRLGPRKGKNLLEKNLQSHIKEITRKLKEDKEMKQN